MVRALDETPEPKLKFLLNIQPIYIVLDERTQPSLGMLDEDSLSARLNDPGARTPLHSFDRTIPYQWRIWASSFDTRGIEYIT